MVEISLCKDSSRRACSADGCREAYRKVYCVVHSSLLEFWQRCYAQSHCYCVKLADEMLGYCS